MPASLTHFSQGLPFTGETHPGKTCLLPISALKHHLLCPGVTLGGPLESGLGKGGQGPCGKLDSVCEIWSESFSLSLNVSCESRGPGAFLTETYKPFGTRS